MNGLRVVDLLNRGDVPVARGMANPLVEMQSVQQAFTGRMGWAIPTYHFLGFDPQTRVL